MKLDLEYIDIPATVSALGAAEEVFAEFSREGTTVGRTFGEMELVLSRLRLAITKAHNDAFPVSERDVQEG